MVGERPNWSFAPPEHILGYEVWSAHADECVRSVRLWIDTGDRCRWLACLNPHSYAVALDERPFRAALESADWLIPDGGGVVLASRLLGGSIRSRVTGSDIFSGVHAELDRTGGSAFFLGSTEETLVKLRERMSRDYPNVRVAGTYSPPFRASFSRDETDAMVRAVNAARADVLWVSMTAPKQELWIHGQSTRLEVKFAAAIGAVFDFYTGRVTRSHPAFQSLGLEWLPRLVREPRRLWRRTFISAPRFLLDVARSGARRNRRESR